MTVADGEESEEGPNEGDDEEMHPVTMAAYLVVNLTAIAGIGYGTYVAVASGGSRIPFLVLAASFVVGFVTAPKLHRIAQSW